MNGSMGGGGVGGGNQATMMGMMNNQAPGNVGSSMGMNNLNLNDLRRLQQLQAQLQGTTSNNILSNQNAACGQPPSTAMLQNLLDQKLQTSRFDDSLRNQLGMSGMSGMNGMVGQGNQMLGSNLFPERIMMNQPSGIGGGGGGGGAFNKPPIGGGDVPLLPPQSLFPRDGSRRIRGGVIEPFPERLHRLLCEVEAAGRSDVISFVAGGRAFAIHKPDKFFNVCIRLGWFCLITLAISHLHFLFLLFVVA